MDYTDSPDYLKASDLHNLGAGTTSFFSDPVGKIGDIASDAADFVTSVPAWAAASVVSGANSIYNSGVVAGNFLGVTDTQEQDTQQLMTGLDQDLGQYYSAHKQLVDTSGFIATSFIPGLGGMKIMNAGREALGVAMKTGTVARGFAEATGLVETAIGGKSLATIAGEALAQGSQTFTVMDAGVLKALSASVGKAALESFAFEAAVQATMFRSPLLQDQDFKDVASNILTGTLLGGAIGGALGSAHVYGDIKKVITKVDLEQKPLTIRASQAGLEGDPAAKIVVGANDLAETPTQLLKDGVLTDFTPREVAMRDARVTAIEQERRIAIHSLSSGDKELGNYLADVSTGMEPDQVTGLFAGSQKIARVGEALEPTEGNTAGYITMHGEGAGTATFDAIDPKSLTLADKLGSKNAILAAVKDAKFDTKTLWRMSSAGSMDEIQARYIWADNTAKYTDGMVIHQSDLPLLEGAQRAGLAKVTVEGESGFQYVINNPVDLANEVKQAKLALIPELARAGKSGWQLAGEGPLTNDQIARATNVSVARIESREDGSMFARQDAQAAYDDMRKANGLSESTETNLDYIPKYAQVIYKTAGISANGDTVAAMVTIKAQQKLVTDSVDRVVASIAGDINDRLFRPGDKAMLNSNRYGSGAGLFTFSNGGYGTLSSWAENVGAVASDLVTTLKKQTGMITDSALLRLRANPVAAIEFDKINNLVASTTEKYILNETGDGLVSAKLAKYQAAVKAGEKNVVAPELQAGAPSTIPFMSQETGDAITAHMQANGRRVGMMTDLKNAVGLTDMKDPNAFYPIKPSPLDMKFFAFVKDPTVTGSGMGHTSMIHATSAEDLEAMIGMVRKDGKYSVYTKTDSENFYKAQQDYDFDRTLHDNYIDSGLKSAGINNQFFPKTDPDSIADYIQKFHDKNDSILARETISTKFLHEFDQLETMGSQYSNIAGSRYAISQRQIENTSLNPYNDYRKTALNISRLSEYPILSSINKTLEDSVSNVYDKISRVWNTTKSAGDLDAVNAALKEAGVDHAYGTAAEVLLANHTAPRPVLSQFIRGANSILSNTFLRLDPMNSLNNAIGAQVLLGSETSQQMRALLRGADAAGITVPGTSDSILAPAKLIGNSNSKWFAMMRDDPAALADKQYYKDNGYLTSLHDQHKQMLDTLTLGGTENPAQLNTKLSEAFGIGKYLTEKVDSLGNIGEKLTGNKLAEEYNRFVAADVAKQIAQKSIDAGLMDADGMTAYIKTFVNRTQGNMLASQRPLIFQGPIGQAVGLFQTFQFNTMQQLFRSVSEGGAKDAALMMGLQGTMYGMNGLPAFQYINQHIIGTASGNPNHTDAYSTLYGAAGKTAGDWLMYGVPSNLLQNNIYSRGDINPRTLTVIPTNPADIVAVSAFAKFAVNIKDTFGKLADGGNLWETMLQGIEHNGLSRPLAGLAQTLQATTGEGKVYSTNNKGDISFVNDFMSLATMGRLAGAKPLDEALANDEIGRTLVYKAADSARMKTAQEAFKTNVIGKPNDVPTDSAVNDYMNSFVHAGGQVQDFNKQVLKIMTTVNTPKANQISQSLKGPYAEHMKLMMNGNVADLTSLDNQ